MKYRYFFTASVLLAILIGPGGITAAKERPVKEFTFVVQEKKITLMKDPKKEVTVYAYGLEGEDATVPGPVIRVKEGDLVRVHFKNTHKLPHTIHLHGIHPFNMDGNGVAALGEEQLQMPGQDYTYEFVANGPGYYFYHCHFDTVNHIDHGMYGLLIIEDPSWPKVDRELITVWDEWDVDGDGKYDTHTINTKSFPDATILTPKMGEKVRLIMANIGYETHAPHMHGVVWNAINPGDMGDVMFKNPNSTVTIGAGEIKVVEFTPTQPGTWLFHCHVVPHVADDGAYPRGMLALVSVEK
jgi:FtsP/CotA-like multicopper oxidase with cupredoxin domain